MKFKYRDSKGQVTLKEAIQATPEKMKECYLQDIQTLTNLRSSLLGDYLQACNELIQSRQESLCAGGYSKPGKGYNPSLHLWLIIIKSDIEIEGNYGPDTRKPLTKAKNSLEKSLHQYRSNILKSNIIEWIEH